MIYLSVIPPSATSPELSLRPIVSGSTGIRYTDLFFTSADGLEDLISQSRVELTRYELDGGGGELIELSGVLSANGNRLRFDFGVLGLGFWSGDGYYEIGLDIDGNGSFETTRHFYRLMSDVNGDRTVNTTDRSMIAAAIGQTGPNLDADVDGRGSVDVLDWFFAWLNAGESLDGGLPLDD